MGHIFIAHVEEDADIALGIALGLEEAGYRTWSYEVDSVVGASYIVQTGEAVAQSDAVIVIISPNSLSSNQVTSEVVRAHESRRHFLPILRGISHVEFQQRQPEWREAIGAAASIRIPREGVTALLPLVIEGLKSLRIKPNPRADTERIGRLHRELDEILARPASPEGAIKVQAKPVEENKKSKSRMPLLMSLSSVIIIAVILLVFFLPRGGGGGEPDQESAAVTTTSSPAATSTSTTTAMPTTTPTPTTTTPITTTPTTTTPTTTTPTAATPTPTSTLPTTTPPATTTPATTTPAAITSTPSSPTPPPDLPTPQAGKGVIWGKVMWGEHPVAGVEVEIGTGITTIIGIGGGTSLDAPVYKIVTDPQGYYVLSDVEPGGYVRRFNAFGSWYYPDGQYLYHKFTLNADQTISKGIYYIVREDLTLNTPADDAAVSYDNLTLTWQAYPEAHHYQVKLVPEGIDAFKIDATTDTAYTHPQPLLNGTYTWSISAYNENGQEIAESPERSFTVTGAAYSIYVEITYPADEASVSGSALTLEWQPYPGTSYYKIYVTISGSGSTIVSFVKVTGTTYTIPQTLEPAEYYWSVDAYDSSGKKLADSGGYYFTVP